MKAILSLLFSFGVMATQACDCDWVGNFFDLAKHAQVVVKVEVLPQEADPSTYPPLQVKVLKTFRGSSFGEVLTINSYSDCDIEASMLKAGEVYYMSLIPQSNGYNLMADCGEYYVKATGDAVGTSDKSNQWMPRVKRMKMAEFEEQLKKLLTS